MIKLKTISIGIKKNSANTVSEISNYNLLGEIAKNSFDNKKEVAKFDYIESLECMKVTDSINRVAYFNNELFNYVYNKAKSLYLVEDGAKFCLAGVNGEKIIVCAPYTTSSVECYL